MGVPLHRLLNKRILGYLSWRYRRRFEYQPGVLSVVAPAAYRDGEHLVITGDLTQIGLPEECREARLWLESLGHADEVSVIPGNHDAYVRLDWQRGIGLWQPWMRSDADYEQNQPFPFIRRRGPVVFIGLSSAVPTMPLAATGKVSVSQLQRLETALTETKGYFRVLLIHHSPSPDVDPLRKRLLNHGALRELLSRVGVELVLHGHTHRPIWSQLSGPEGDIPVVGVPAASAMGYRNDGTVSMRRGGYYAYTVRPARKGWKLEITTYRLNLAGSALEECSNTHHP